MGGSCSYYFKDGQCHLFNYLGGFQKGKYPCKGILDCELGQKMTELNLKLKRILYEGELI
jgi:hypothetical protein